MAFDVDAQRYDRFMGRFSRPLAVRTVEFLAPARDSRALDVGCGPGALTAELVGALGPDQVAGVDPSANFVAAARTRLPGVDLRAAVAAELPHPDDAFDLTVAQLVVHFLPDPLAGLREMARVTRPGGRVAATVWDFGGRRSPLSTFWGVVQEIDPRNPGETERPGTTQGHLAELFRASGLEPDVDDELQVHAAFASFEAWWQTYTLGVGPAGDHVTALDPTARADLRERCSAQLPDGGFTIDATAMFVCATIPRKP